MESRSGVTRFPGDVVSDNSRRKPEITPLRTNHRRRCCFKLERFRILRRSPVFTADKVDGKELVSLCSSETEE